jgi:hypothetical protein
MKKFVIILVLITVLGTFFYYLGLPFSEWQTYANSRYEFQIDFPAEWELGDIEQNNAGRTFYPSNEEAFCYAYGFENALTNEHGNPQSLDEFIDWLAAEDGARAGFNVKAIERNPSTLALEPAVHLLLGEDNGIKEAVYAIGKETGIGFFCTYANIDLRNNYKDIFNNIAASFRLDNQLDEDVVTEGGDCNDYLAGVFTPLKDKQMFFDDSYTEVTMTSREAWDRSRLPQEVQDLEKMSYTCYPMPLEFDNGEPEGDVLPQPEVTMIQWDCELEYEEWEYINGLEFIWPSNDFHEKWTSCVKQDCWRDGVGESNVWLCTK